MAFVVDPDAEWGSAIIWSVLLMFLSLPGDYMAAHGRRIAVALGVIAGLILIPVVVRWEPAQLAVIAGYVAAFGGMLTLAAIRAGIGSIGRWVLLAATVLLPVALLVPVAFGLVANQRGIFAILLPYGLAWILLGLRLAIRGSATIIDQPMATIGSEVRPA